jgi:threonine dehydrogenase-like Zn-dependent dehydrogenase
MKRARLLAPRELVFEELPLEADRLGPRELYATTECTAVSIGTEYAAFAGHPPLRPSTPYPRVVGYCNVARVVSRGDAVTGIRLGDRVLTNQPHQSAFIAAARDVLAVVPETVPSAPASLAYLAGLGLAALQKARFRPGETVAVLGLGVIGLATVAVAQALGAHVIALGNDDGRLAVARDVGAHLPLRSDAERLTARIAEGTAGVGIDVLVTTANAWEAWRVALEVARSQTRIAVLGFPGREEGAPPFNPLASAHLYDKQLTIVAAGPVPGVTLTHNMQLLLRLVEQRRLPLDRLITHIVPWNELGAVYELAVRRDRALIGAVLDWSK